MKIKFLTSIAGGINFNAGDIADIPDAEASRLIAGGIAEAAEKVVKRVTPLETAVIPAIAAERVAILPEGKKGK